MGVADFLTRALHSSGTPVDLRQYRDGINVVTTTSDFSPTNNNINNNDDDDNNRRKKRRRSCRKRPLRIAVDVSHWIYKATFRFGPMLADERHLTNYGRYQLVNHHEKQQQQRQQQQEEQQQEQPEANGESISEEAARKYIISCTMFVIERLDALKRETKGDILVVLDGATPPIKMKTVLERSNARKESVKARDAPIDVIAASSKLDDDGNSNNRADQLKERMKANRRAGAGPLFSRIIEELLLAMRHKSIPYLVAPYEADGQLAWLSRERLVDLIITEDSDLIAQGGVCMLYKMNISNVTQVASLKESSPRKKLLQKQLGSSKEEDENEYFGTITFVPSGTLLLKDDLGAVPISRSADTGSMEHLSMRDMSEAMLAVIFVAAGSDYCKSLSGIGLVTACEIVHQSFLQPCRQPQLARVFDLLFHRTYDKKMQCSLNLQEEYRENFLSALLMYRHPVVYSPIERKCVTVSERQGDPELLTYPPYRTLFNNHLRRAAIVGDLMENSMLPSLIAEGWVSPRTKMVYTSAKDDKNIPDAVKHYYGLVDDIVEMRRSQQDQAQSMPQESKAKNLLAEDQITQMENTVEHAEAEAEQQRSQVEAAAPQPESEAEAEQAEANIQAQSDTLQPETQESCESSIGNEVESQFTTDSHALETQIPFDVANAQTVIETQNDSQQANNSLLLQTQASPKDAEILLGADSNSEDGSEVLGSCNYAPRKRAAPVGETNECNDENLAPETQPGFHGLSNLADVSSSDDEALPTYSLGKVRPTHATRHELT